MRLKLGLLKPSLPRQGFALPAVLAVTGVVSLIFLVAITALTSLTAEANSARQRVRFLQRALTAEAIMTFMAATEPRRPDGVMINGVIEIDDIILDGEAPADGQTSHLIRMDARPYLMNLDSPLVVRVQDQAGLVNLNLLTRSSFDRLLTQLGVPSLQHGVLFARFVDYLDYDGLRQPEGAEVAQYGQARIANRLLMHPGEFLSVLGMREQVDRRAWQRIEPHLSADRQQARFNLNTATGPAINIMLDANDRQIERLIEGRNTIRIRSDIDVESILGQSLNLSEDYSYSAPSQSLWLSFNDSQSSWTYRARLTISPLRQERPVWIDQTQLLEAPGRARTDTTDADRLPYAPY